MADRQHKTTGADQPSAASAASIRPTTGNQGTSVLSAFQLHQLALKRFISKYLNNAQDIEDVTQEAFMRAYSIAKNVAISQLRTKSRQITDYIEDQPTADVLLSEWSTEDEVMAQWHLRSPRCHPNAGGST